MVTDVRTITDDELLPWLEAASAGFLDRLDHAALAAEVRPHWDLGRAWAAWQDARVVGTFRTWHTDLTVPGLRQVGATAVTGVTVLPTHRRQGILSALARAEAEAARERGELVAILYASEYPIYGRFGYGPATTTATWTLDADRALFHGTIPDTGSVELLPPDGAGRDTAKAVFEAWRVQQPGELWRRPITWQTDFGTGGGAWGPPWKGFLAVHRDDAGAVDGYVRYHVEGKWTDRQPRSKAIVDDLHALTDDAYAALWRFLAAMDWVVTVEAPARRADERLCWLLVNARAASVSEVGDGMWLKLLDVPGALAARAYERPAKLTLEVLVRDGGTSGSDGQGERVRVALDAGPHGVSARSTDALPDLTLDGAALGAAYLGGTRLRDAVLARGVDEHRSGALAELDGALATEREPWASTFF
jgi:predicted acetyltransferase